jgi:hypothetical protein
MQTMVFVVNILSLRKYHVNIGNATYEAENAINRELQTPPSSSTQSFVPNRKQKPTGIE